MQTHAATAEALKVGDFNTRNATTPIRRIYGEALLQAALADARIVALSADLTAATETDLFRDTLPERFFQVGIAEANMIGIAGGMARQGDMPFAVLLEIALQPCGWLAAYLGSALTSEIDLSFRNLGGTATQFVPVRPDAGTLTTTVKITHVANSGGMIIQHFDYEVRSATETIYRGNTYFGFFSKAALSEQVGIREAKPYLPTAVELARGQAFDFPTTGIYPGTQLRMVDRVTCFIHDGGPTGLGFIRGTKRVDPDEWFFKAHFFEDPVCPGSLGLESFLQLLKVLAVKRWGESAGARLEAIAAGEKHEWTYRGQIIPTDREVVIEAVVTGVDDTRRLLRADGYLFVDGRTIYGMKDFTVSCREH